MRICHTGLNWFHRRPTLNPKIGAIAAACTLIGCMIHFTGIGAITFFAGGGAVGFGAVALPRTSQEQEISLPPPKPLDLKRTPLHLAAEIGDMETAEEFLGDDLHARDLNGQTPLHRAVSHPKVLEFLLDQGANINEKDDLGHTALDYASLGYLSESVELLKTRGAKTEPSFPFKPLKFFDINKVFKEILIEIQNDLSDSKNQQALYE